MAKLPDPFQTLTPEAKGIYDKITAKRGQMRGGPFASLMPTRRWRRKSATSEWVAHARIARTENLPDDVIERIRTRGDLSALPPRYARPARIVQHVLAYESIPQDLLDNVKGELAMTGLIELVTLAGQYRLIAGVLFAFDSPLPEGTPPPF